MEPLDRLLTFRSLSHPGASPIPVVFGRFLVRPLAATMIPAMLVGLVLVLQAVDPLPFVLWAFPGAMVLAMAWTWFRMRSEVVEIVVSHNGAILKSVLEAAGSHDPGRLQRVFDVRPEAESLNVTVGHTATRLARAEWPESLALHDALVVAKAFFD